MMATGGKKTPSSSRSVKGSDFISDFSCNPCEKEGNTIEAINFCVDCLEYFCLACTKQHKRFQGSSGHNVVNRTLANKVGGAKQSSGVILSEECKEHHGEKINTYCVDHDLVLCNICVSVDHRLCGGISYIPKVAGGSKQSKDVPNVQQELSHSLTVVSQTKLSLQNLLATADEEKNEQQKRIRNCTEGLIKHARDLEKSALDDVNGCHKKTTDRLRSEVRSLDDAAMAMSARLKNLDNVKVNSESQVFIDIKQGRQEVERASHLKENVSSASAGKAMPEFVVREDVEYFLNKIGCLGQYVEKLAYNVTLYSEYDVKMSGDLNECDITDSCELPDGTILIADYNNGCIKKLDKSFRTTKHLNLSPGPWGICQTEEDEVAVTLTDERKVQFVNVRRKLNITRAFTVSECCRGIMCSMDELFVSCGGYAGDEGNAAEGPRFVGAYNMTGTLLRTIQLDHHGRQIFSIPYHITASDNGNKLHIADENGGIITIDRQGNVLSTFSEGLQFTNGGCTMVDDDLLVCWGDSNNVLQISADGKMVTQLLGEEDGIKGPQSLLFLRESSRLVVTEVDSDKIKIFNLQL